MLVKYIVHFRHVLGSNQGLGCRSVVECLPRICKEGPELSHSLTKEMFKDVRIAWKITRVYFDSFSPHSICSPQPRLCTELFSIDYNTVVRRLVNLVIDL